jgi:hypothetical protein
VESSSCINFVVVFGAKSRPIMVWLCGLALIFL